VRFSSHDVALEAKKRWAQHYSFDLEDGEWLRLCETYTPGEVLQAIRRTQYAHSQDPAKLYKALVYWLERLSEERKTKTTFTNSEQQERAQQ
jgi:FMN phosphatase YigB (HAD superfamily)